MITRQFLLLLQAQSFSISAKDPATALSSSHPYRRLQARRGQARQSEQAQLETMYHHLLETDLAIKTSLSEETVALDSLVTELSTQA